MGKTLALIGRLLFVGILPIILLSTLFIPYSMAFLCDGYTNAEPDKVCSGRGVCVDLNKCECKDGFVGANCQDWTCYGRDYRHPDVCFGNGECVGPDTCECGPGYGGNECQTPN